MTPDRKKELRDVVNKEWGYPDAIFRQTVTECLDAIDELDRANQELSDENKLVHDKVKRLEAENALLDEVTDLAAKKNNALEAENADQLVRNGLMGESNIALRSENARLREALKDAVPAIKSRITILREYCDEDRPEECKTCGPEIEKLKKIAAEALQTKEGK